MEANGYKMAPIETQKSTYERQPRSVSLERYVGEQASQNDYHVGTAQNQ